MRRILAVLVLTGLFALPACTDGDDPGAGSSSPGPSAPTTATPGEPLSAFVYGEDEQLRAYRRIAQQFTQESGIEVDLHVYDGARRAADAALTGLRNGFGPDVFLLDQAYLGKFVDPPLVEPLDDLLEQRGLQFGDDYQRWALTAMSADAALQCMPAEMSPLVVYFNRDLLPRRALRQQGVSQPVARSTWTWDDFEATARAIAGRDDLGPIKGVSIPGDLDLVTAWVRSAGGEVTDSDAAPTRLDLESDEAVQTIRQIAQLARDPSVALTREQLEEKSPLAWFLEGQLGLIIGTRADLPALREAEGLDFDVAPLPSFGSASSVSSISGWCVNADSGQVPAAADFVAFAAGPAGSRVAASSGAIVPARLDTVSSSVFLQRDQQPRHAKVFAAAVRDSEPLPFAKDWPAVEEVAEIELGDVFTDPFADLDRLRKRLRELDAKSERLLAEPEE